MQEVYRANDPQHAHLLAGALLGAGFTASVEGELVFGTRGEAPLDMSTLPAVCIADGEDGARAREIIEEFLAAKPSTGEPWTCTCGQQIEAQFTACWSCGQEREA